MIKSFFRILGIGTDSAYLNKSEPIYGLSKRSLAKWLSRNPRLKKGYERELVVRLQGDRAARDARSYRHAWALRSWRYLVHATRYLRVPAR